MPKKSKLVAGVVAGAGAAAFVLALDGLGPLVNSMAGGRSGGGSRPLQAVEWRTYDWRMTRTADPSTARPDLALIEIDEYSLRNLQPNAGRWPWPRAVHSMLLDYLARAPARVIVYDVNFAEPDTRTGFLFGGDTWSGEESDRALIDSVKAAGNVILPIDAAFEGEMAPGAPPVLLRDEGFSPSPAVSSASSGSLASISSGSLERRVVFPPFAALAQAAASFGHSLLVFDSDGPVRHTVPFVASGGTSIPSLGLAAALRATGVSPADVRLDRDGLRVKDRRLPLTSRAVAQGDQSLEYGWGLVNFRGPALLSDGRRPYANYSFFDLLVSEEQLLANQTPKVDPSLFKDKAVFVGVTASGLSDVFETPFAQGKMPGIQVHAAVADDIMSNRFLRPSGSGLRTALLSMAALLAGLLAVTVPVSWSIGGVLALLALFWIAATRAFAGGLWINVTEPTLAASLALFAGVAYDYVVEGREKRIVTQLFSRYVSRDVFSQLVAHPEMAQLYGNRREMTVLFSDIRGFTTFSERATPEDVVRMLNEYFTRMVEVVFRNRGTVDKFVGDMVMALFGAPLDDPDHGAHAIDAALDMLDELRALNAKWAAEGRFASLDIGIGISTGPMIAGNIGSESIMSYTVIGDTVNLGARLQGLNKDFGTRILVSRSTYEGLSDRYIFKALGDVVVKGRSQPVSIYEVVGRTGAARDGQATEVHEEYT